MLRRSFLSTSSSTNVVSANHCSLVVVAASCASSQRGMKIRKESWFVGEAIPHSRRVSWSPLTTTKKQGAFARLSRSNFYDPTPIPFTSEPYTEMAVEAHRSGNETPDVYIYKYSVSPTHLSLRPGNDREH